MLVQTLEFIAEELNTYLAESARKVEHLPEKLVILDNIANINTQKMVQNNQVVLTLINISEESALKNMHFNPPIHSRASMYENLPVGLGLHLLFSAYMSNYELSLVYISHIISFFKLKNVFTRQNSPGKNHFIPDEVSIIVEFQSLSFAEMCQLWSILGSNQQPFVCYKLRLQSAG